MPRTFSSNTYTRSGVDSGVQLINAQLDQISADAVSHPAWDVVGDFTTPASTYTNRFLTLKNLGSANGKGIDYFVTFFSSKTNSNYAYANALVHEGYNNSTKAVTFGPPRATGSYALDASGRNNLSVTLNNGLGPGSGNVMCFYSPQWYTETQAKSLIAMDDDHICTSLALFTNSSPGSWFALYSGIAESTTGPIVDPLPVIQCPLSAGVSPVTPAWIREPGGVSTASGVVTSPGLGMDITSSNNTTFMVENFAKTRNSGLWASASTGDKFMTGGGLPASDIILPPGTMQPSVRGGTRAKLQKTKVINGVLANLGVGDSVQLDGSIWYYFGPLFSSSYSAMVKGPS